MGYLKKKLTVFNLIVLLASLVLIVFYFFINYTELVLVRSSIGSHNGHIGINAFAMTFGNEDWVRDYVFNFWPVFLLIIPIAMIGLLFLDKKINKIIILLLSLGGIFFIFNGYLHMYNLYIDAIFPQVDRVDINLTIGGYFYIAIFVVIITSSIIFYLRDRKKDN